MSATEKLFEIIDRKGNTTFGMVRCTEPFIVSGWGEGIRVAFPDRSGMWTTASDSLRCLLTTYTGSSYCVSLIFIAIHSTRIREEPTPIIRKSQGEGPCPGERIVTIGLRKDRLKNEPTTGNINWNIMFQLIFRTAVGLANDMEGIISSVKDPWRKGNGSWAWRYGRCTRGSRWRGW